MSKDTTQDPNRGSRRREVLAWAWCAVILVACWLPRTRMPVSEVVPRAIPEADKAVHFLLFAVFSVLWMRARPSPMRIAIAGIVLAIVSELGQAVPFVGRDAGVWDAIADIVGVLAGIALAARFHWTVRGTVRDDRLPPADHFEAGAGPWM